MDTVTTQIPQTKQTKPMKVKPKAKAKAKPKKSKQKTTSLTKRIVLASDEGKSPREIAELLGINAQTVYSVRWQEKMRRKNTVGTIGTEMGTEHWFQQEVAKAAKQNKTETNTPTDWDEIVRAYKAMEAAPVNEIVRAYKAMEAAPVTPPPKFTFNEPHAPALLPPQTFFARIKAAYTVLRGVK